MEGKQQSLKCLLQILIRDTINLHRTLELSVTFFVLFLSSLCDLTVIWSLQGTGDQRYWALESLAGAFASVPIDISVMTRRFLRVTLIQQDDQSVVSAVLFLTHRHGCHGGSLVYIRRGGLHFYKRKYCVQYDSAVK